MTLVVISLAGESRIGGYGDKYQFTPCLRALQGETEIMRAWIELDGLTGEIITRQLAASGVEDPHAMLKQAMIRLATRRFEPLVREALASTESNAVDSPTWKLGRDDMPALLDLATDKTCEYQATIRRDLFCTIASANDTSAMLVIDARPAAPTSRHLCKACDLPDTDYLCSRLLHPTTTGLEAIDYYSRHISQRICDLGHPEVADHGNCHLGGHPCAQRILQLEPAPTTAQLSALTVAESFDVLDAHWRLAFGKTRRLVTLSTVTGPSSLSLNCTNRSEFESRLSALVDLIDRLTVDDDLLPAGLTDEQKTGSLNRLELTLKDKLPAHQHPPVTRATTTLRRIRQARNAAQHGLAQGGLTERLAALSITTAPPDWAQAWDTIRAATVDAVTAIRQELRGWIDTPTA